MTEEEIRRLCACTVWPRHLRRGQREIRLAMKRMPVKVLTSHDRGIFLVASKNPKLTRRLMFQVEKLRGCAE